MAKNTSKQVVIGGAIGTVSGGALGATISNIRAKKLAKQYGIKPGSKEYKDLVKKLTKEGIIIGTVSGGVLGAGAGLANAKLNIPIKDKKSKSKSTNKSKDGTSEYPVSGYKKKSKGKTSTSTKRGDVDTSEYPMSEDYDFKEVLEAKKKGKKDFEERHPEMRGEVEVTKLPLSKEDQAEHLAAIEAIYKDKSLSPEDKRKLLTKIQIETEKKRPALISEKIYKNKKGENKSQNQLRIDARNARIKNHIKRQVGRKPEQYINAKFDDDPIITSGEVLKRWDVACKKHKERTGEWPARDQEVEYFNKINKRYWSQPNQIATPEQRQDFRKWQKSRAHTKGDLPNWDSYSKMKGINSDKPVRKVNMYSQSMINHTKYFALPSLGKSSPIKTAGLIGAGVGMVGGSIIARNKARKEADRQGLVGSERSRYIRNQTLKGGAIGTLGGGALGAGGAWGNNKLKDAARSKINVTYKSTKPKNPTDINPLASKTKPTKPKRIVNNTPRNFQIAMNRRFKASDRAMNALKDENTGTSMNTLHGTGVLSNLQKGEMNAPSMDTAARRINAFAGRVESGQFKADMTRKTAQGRGADNLNRAVTSGADNLARLRYNAEQKKIGGRTLTEHEWNDKNIPEVGLRNFSLTDYTKQFSIKLFTVGSNLKY